MPGQNILSRANIFVFIVLLLAVLAVFGAPLFSFLNVGSFLFGFQADHVYAPLIGTITCRETTSSNENATGIVNQQGVVGDLYRPGAFDPQLLPAYSELTYADLFNYQYYRDGPPTHFTLFYQCTQSRCEFREANPDNWVTCPSGHKALYRASVGGAQLVSNKVFNNSSLPGIFAPQYFSVVDGITGDEKINEGEAFLFEGTCIGTSGSAGAIGRSAYPTNVNVPLRVYAKQFEINVPEGVPTYVPSTQGCTWNDLYNSTAGHPLGPQNNSVLQSIYNIATGQSAVGSEDISNLIPPRDSMSRSTIVEPYSVNQQKTFVAGWQEISGVNVITLPSGENVIYHPNSNTIYKVNTIALSNGQNAYVANEIWRQNPQCYYDFPCQQTFGDSWACNRTDTTLGELFTCFDTAPQGGNECTVATQLVDCGQPFYRTTGGQVEYISPQCIDGSCQFSSRGVSCNPGAAIGANGCPLDRPICSASSNGNTQCIEQVVPKLPCPDECCIESALYYKKDCPSGLVCQASGGIIGQCVTPPDDEFCGDGICQEPAESCDSCSIDCGQCDVPVICPFGTHLSVAIVPEYFFELGPIKIWQTGQTVVNQCVPDIGLSTILIVVAILLGFFILANTIRKPGKKKKKRR